MPMLDVSWVVMDPMLSDSFTVTRRAESIDSNGRPVITPTSFPNLVGVVTQGDPNTLVRDDDSDYVPRVINVVSKFAFRNVSVGFKPDLITWNGTDYLVKQVSPYNRFGNGFYEATAASMTTTDAPQ